MADLGLKTAIEDPPDTPQQRAGAGVVGWSRRGGSTGRALPRSCGPGTPHRPGGAADTRSSCTSHDCPSPGVLRSDVAGAPISSVVACPGCPLDLADLGSLGGPAQSVLRRSTACREGSTLLSNGGPPRAMRLVMVLIAAQRIMAVVADPHRLQAIGSSRRARRTGGRAVIPSASAGDRAPGVGWESALRGGRRSSTC